VEEKTSQELNISRDASCEEVYEEDGDISLHGEREDKSRVHMHSDIYR